MSAVINALKEIYFGWLKQEDFPNTPILTKDIDILERKIKKEMKI